MTPDEPPFPSPADLIAALQRLDADLIAGFALARDEVARARLRDRIRRVKARANAMAIDQFANQQRETVGVMMAVLNEWAAMLDALRLVVSDGAQPPAANDSIEA